jgi:hypothetical protein
MVGSQKELDQKNLRLELIRYINANPDVNPRALI